MVVISSAVKADNPEVEAARRRWIPVVRRAEMLGELMRLKWAIAVGGTHGKTTTTSMIGWLLDGAGFDPTVINGGIINAYGTNARLGDGDWMVVEADESDGTFLKLPATIACRHQHRPRAPGPLRLVRRRAPRLRRLRREHPVLRLRRAVHRPSRGAGADRARLRPPHRHLRPEPAGRRARRQPRDPRRRLRLRRRADRPGDEEAAHDRRPLPADVRPAQRAERAGRVASPRRWASPTRVLAERWRASAASSGASPGPAKRTASP